MGVVVGLGGRHRHRGPHRLRSQDGANPTPALRQAPGGPSRAMRVKARYLGAPEKKGEQLLKSGEFGAGDRDRTDDIQLGKLTFYH